MVIVQARLVVVRGQGSSCICGSRSGNSGTASLLPLLEASGAAAGGSCLGLGDPAADGAAADLGIGSLVLVLAVCLAAASISATALFFLGTSHDRKAETKRESERS